MEVSNYLGGPEKRDKGLGRDVQGSTLAYWDDGSASVSPPFRGIPVPWFLLYWVHEGGPREIIGRMTAAVLVIVSSHA